MNYNTPFKLFSNCITVKGKNRSVICDLQRHDLFLIPNELYIILNKYQGKTLELIKKEYKNKFDSEINEYFDFLKENELIFFTNTPNLFPDLPNNWNVPSKINNFILDINCNSKYNFRKIIKELNILNCGHIEIRIFEEIDYIIIYSLFNIIKELNSSIISIELILPLYIENDKNNLICNFLKTFKRLTIIKFYNSTDTILKKVKSNDFTKFIYYSNEKVINQKKCGIINQKSFVINNELYTESINHNSCLNRKISIDINGNIKNCPSMKQSFGNIKNTTLEEALNHKDFKKYWNITKDQIDVCKDCEFRHVCTDCRAYIEKPSDKYSKPLKCGYSPYTNEWEEWSTNPLKQKAIEYYGMQELVKKDNV